MRKILLTSTGLQNNNFYNAFSSLLNKPLNQVVVLLIPTASERSEDELFFVRKTQRELINVGIQDKNIIWFNSTSNCHFNQMFDCIVVCGGNTYYLLSKLKESHYFEFISNKIDEGIPYIGISAGSVVATNNIEYIQCMDENDCHISDFKGFGWIEGILLPHFDEKEETKRIVESERASGHTVYTISDEQAVLINDENISIITVDIEL